MNNLGQEFSFELLLLATLEIPTIWALFRYFSLPSENFAQAAAWLEHRRANYVLFLLVIVVWSSIGQTRFPSSIFWIAPPTSCFLLLWLMRVIDKRILDRKWKASDIVRLAFWGTIHPGVTVLLLATGFERVLDKRWSAILWFLGSAFAALVGSARLRATQGFKRRRVKSGTLYVRALHLAKRMGASIKWIYVVPPGRGTLTNAFASWRSIALTDNFGEFLHGPQLDFVIAHELAHIKNKHSRKQLLFLLSGVVCLSLISLTSVALIKRYESIFVLGFLLATLLSYLAMSRRFEYQADRDAALVVGNSQAGMRALTALYKKTGTPIQTGLLIELFMSHPCLVNRTSALARLFRHPEIAGTVMRETESSDGAPIPQPE